MIKQFSFVVLLGLFGNLSLVKAQGCSDAGFCTINSIKPQDEMLAEHSNQALFHQIKLGLSSGKADNSVSIFSQYLEYNLISKNWGFDAKITGINQSGNGISEFGLSDVFLNGNIALSSKMRLTAGLKFPLQDGNTRKNGNSLPMDYQSSLGTTDVILGLGYQFEKVQFVVAMQQPVTQNKNAFLADVYPANSTFSEFQSTNSYQRKGDVLMRVSYVIEHKNKLKSTVSLLPIYHLSDDEFTNSNGVNQMIKGSAGLTLNANLFLDYELSQKQGIQASIGMPLLTREARPDGLTRAFVATIEYRVRF
ncbi:hypothetical protein EP331_13110 [bacterium]|nr:MAG: hypothetical protein EP331_13110 [bacterium]